MLRSISNISQGLRQLTLSSNLYAASDQAVLKRPANAFFLYKQENMEVCTTCSAQS